jgi:hypothetical protein
MEMSQLFTVCVLGICATHLVWTAAAHIGTWLGANKKNALHAGARQERSDWYVFFSCADLIGPEPKKTSRDTFRDDRPQVSKKDSRPQIRPSVQA